jgi:hypothetical protein
MECTGHVNCVLLLFWRSLFPVIREFSAKGKTMSSASFENVRSMEQRSATNKLWQPGWGTIVMILAILQLLLSVMLDR